MQLERAEKSYVEVHTIENEVKKLDKELARSVSAATPLIAQDGSGIAELVKRRNAVQAMFQSRWQALHRVHERMEGDFRKLDLDMRIHPGLRHRLHHLRIFSDATKTARERSRLSAAPRAARSVWARCRRRKERRLAAEQPLSAAYSVDNDWTRRLALDRMRTFYGSQMAHTTRDLGLLANPAEDRGHILALRTSVSVPHNEIRPPVTRVQWDYDQMQKYLASQYPRPISAKPPANVDAQAEWQEAQDTYRGTRRVYDEIHSWEWWQAELMNHLNSGKMKTEEQFNQYVITDVYQEVYQVLATDEARFEEAQDEAMKAGLEPVDVESDLMIFAEHRDDGAVDSESLEMRRRTAIAMPEANMRKRMLDIILWNLKIPYRPKLPSRNAAIPEMLDWNCRSVGLGSSRSQQWNMNKPPSARKRERMDTYIAMQESWRVEADRHYAMCML